MGTLARMPRPLRQEEAGATYHVTTHSVAEAAMVRTDRDRKALLETVAETVLRFRWKCLAVAVLDNHYHLLVTTTEPNLARGMQFLNGTYAQAFNRRYRRKGHLFRERYHPTRIHTDAHFVLAVRYIARNRVEAGIVARPRDDAWSSYPGIVDPAVRWPFVARAELLAHFGRDEAAVRRLIAFVEGRRSTGEASRTDRPRPP